MSGEKYPMMVYKRGDEVKISEKLKVDTKIVKDEGELAEAIGEGYHDNLESLSRVHYQEGGDPPTAAGGYPVDHDFNKGLAGEQGRADRFEGLEEREEVDAEREKAVGFPLGNPPRHEDPSVPPPASETEGADALKKNPGQRTAEAMEEFAEQAEEAEEKLVPKRRGRPPKTEEEKAAYDEKADFGRNPADAAARSKK